MSEWIPLTQEQVEEMDRRVAIHERAAHAADPDYCETCGDTGIEIFYDVYGSQNVARERPCPSCSAPHGKES